MRWVCPHLSRGLLGNSMLKPDDEEQPGCREYSSKGKVIEVNVY